MNIQTPSVAPKGALQALQSLGRDRPRVRPDRSYMLAQIKKGLKPNQDVAGCRGYCSSCYSSCNIA